MPGSSFHASKISVSIVTWQSPVCVNSPKLYAVKNMLGSENKVLLRKPFPYKVYIYIYFKGVSLKHKLEVQL